MNRKGAKSLSLKLKGKRHDSERLFRVKRCHRHQQQQFGEEGQSSSSSSSRSSSKSELLSVVADDILQEIFLRLPDSRSLIECGAVCKRWCSLVSSRSQRGLYVSSANSITIAASNDINDNYKNKNKNKKSKKMNSSCPYTLLLRGSYRNWGEGHPETYCHDILSDKVQNSPLLKEYHLKRRRRIILVFFPSRTCY